MRARTRATYPKALNAWTKDEFTRKDYSNCDLRCIATWSRPPSCQSYRTLITRPIMHQPTNSTIPQLPRTKSAPTKSQENRTTRGWFNPFQIFTIWALCAILDVKVSRFPPLRGLRGRTVQPQSKLKQNHPISGWVIKSFNQFPGPFQRKTIFYRITFGRHTPGGLIINQRKKD